ncbi:MAG: thioredoxin [Verrucomicrobiae bacterium]|nr:thioredoxin [Verrucomicrobiae bacterium]
MKARNVNAVEFEKALGSERPVLVDFWAAWCGPCKAVAPVLDEIAAKYEGRVDVVKVNVDEEGGLAARYSVQSIPTFILFKGGEPVDRVVGALSGPALAQRLDDQLKNPIRECGCGPKCCRT